MPFARALLAVAVLVLLAAHGAAAEPRKPPGEPPLRTRTLAADELVVAVPRGWSSLTQRDAVFPGAIRTITGVYPDLLPLLVGLTSPDSPFRLLAFEPHSDPGLTTTMSVLVRPIAAGTLWDAWTHDVRATVAGAPGLVGPVDAGRVRVPLGDALRLEYLRTPRGAREPVASLQLWLVSGERLISITITSRREDRARYRPLLLALGRALWPIGAERPRSEAPCPPKRLTCA
jgi:hypothetical protein